MRTERGARHHMMKNACCATERNTAPRSERHRNGERKTLRHREKCCHAEKCCATPPTAVRPDGSSAAAVAISLLSLSSRLVQSLHFTLSRARSPACPIQQQRRSRFHLLQDDQVDIAWHPVCKALELFRLQWKRGSARGRRLAVSNAVCPRPFSSFSSAGPSILSRLRHSLSPATGITRGFGWPLKPCGRGWRDRAQ
jgi:hypothetical protein